MSNLQCLSWVCDGVWEHSVRQPSPSISKKRGCQQSVPFIAWGVVELFFDSPGSRWHAWPTPKFGRPRVTPNSPTVKESGGCAFDWIPNFAVQTSDMESTSSGFVS